MEHSQGHMPGSSNLKLEKPHIVRLHFRCKLLPDLINFISKFISKELFLLSKLLFSIFLHLIVIFLSSYHYPQLAHEETGLERCRPAQSHTVSFKKEKRLEPRSPSFHLAHSPLYMTFFIIFFSYSVKSMGK